MKNKSLIIILIVLVLIFLLIINIKSDKQENINYMIVPLIDYLDIILKEGNYINAHLSDIPIYYTILEGGNDKTFKSRKISYLFISIKINKNDSKENQVKSLISEISNSIGFKIDINSIEINNNQIHIDFAKTAAPFELQESNKEDESQPYFVSSESSVPQTIFESINKTLKSYFGSETEVYFSADSENINITNEISTINIDKNIAY